MDREIDLMQYVPNIMREFKEFQAITDSENPEVVALWTAIEDLMNDQFVSDATENGVKRWESIVKITPKGTDDLTVRKFRILARLNETLPYTYRTVEAQLATLCGQDGYTMVLNSGTYTLTVRVTLTVKGQYDEAESFLKRTVPANIVIDLDLLYNQHQTLGQYTHAHLGFFTHDELRNTDISGISYARIEGMQISKLEGVT